MTFNDPLFGEKGSEVLQLTIAFSGCDMRQGRGGIIAQYCILSPVASALPCSPSKFDRVSSSKIARSSKTLLTKNRSDNVKIYLIEYGHSLQKLCEIYWRQLLQKLLKTAKNDGKISSVFFPHRND